MHRNAPLGQSWRIAAELDDDRFTIATDRPPVKVAWRISPRKGGLR